MYENKKRCDRTSVLVRRKIRKSLRSASLLSAFTTALAPVSLNPEGMPLPRHAVVMDILENRPYPDRMMGLG
jgi:hypothetical protein